MTEMTITFPGGKRVNAEFDGLLAATDQPKDNGGEGTAPSPFALFLASIGTCAGIYVLGFCQKRGIPTDGLRLIQRTEVDPDTHAASRIAIEIHVPPTFPAQYHDALVRSANGCLVKKTIEAQPKFEVRTVVDP